jgi:hypothetical protein
MGKHGVLRMIGGLILAAGLAMALASCSLFAPEKITLTDAKIVTAVDQKLMPVKITDTFPRGTQKVSCWFAWKNSKINTQLVARWHYTTDDIHILDYDFNIPKKEGAGSVMLSMPDDKTLPPGQYRIDLALGKKILKRLTFRID